MPLNQHKVVSIILDEHKSVEERCDGYKKELINVIAEIIEAEGQHSVQGTNIQQKIDDKCEAVGDFLAANRGRPKTMKGDI